MGDDLESRVCRLEATLAGVVLREETAKKNRAKDVARIRRLEKIEDTRDTPLLRRLKHVLQGYRWAHLGVWYHAPWNRDGWQYDSKPEQVAE